MGYFCQMLKQITSTNNALIKELYQLKEKSKKRKQSGTFLIEGLREISLAIKGNFKIQKLLFNAAIISYDKLQQTIDTINQIELIEITNEVYKKLAHRGSTEGVLAVAESKNFEISNFKMNCENPLILVAEAPEKPGNIGALLRTADAANLDAVFIANAKTDVFNPNIIRSSVGTVFTVPIATGSTNEILSFLKTNNIDVYCAALSASKPYTEINFTKASALVVGTESTGLSNEWLKNSTQNIIIPMSGAIDSMNVSVSAGILVFEAVRQRNN